MKHPKSSSDSPRGALTGIRVLDLSRVLAGPYCTMVLSDYGAEVIKIEQPGRGDGTRQWGPPWVGEESAYFLSVNRNKKSVAIDLGQPRGASLVRRMADRCDVLIENFKPGRMKRFGLDYETLTASQPGLVYCSISGYGQTGPYADRPGYDLMIQAQGGVMSITGPAAGEPHKVGVAIVDISAGLFAATSILAALHHRQATGEGQYIDVALLDSQVAWLANVAQGYLATGETPPRHGNAHPNIVPYETFATEDGAIAVAVGTDQQYECFCRTIDRPDLWRDERYRTNAARVQHRVALISELQETFRTRSTSRWLDLLLAAAIPASPINDIPAVLSDPQVRARNMVQTVDHPTLGPIDLVGPVSKLSNTPARIRSAPPLLGADTSAVLTELLGCSATDLEDLHTAGVVGLPPSAPAKISSETKSSLTTPEQVRRSATLIVRCLLAVRRGEQVALVCDLASEMEMVRALAEEVQRAGGEFTILQQPDRDLHHKNKLSPVVQRGLEAADCLIGLTRSGGAPTYAVAVKRLLEAKRLRSISMVMRSLANFTQGGALADYDALHADGETLAKIWRPAGRVHLSSAAGTDLRASLGHQEVIIECGFATEPGQEAAFSDGEVSQMPQEGSAEGVLVVDGPIAHLGTPRAPISLRVDAGRVAEVEGSDRVATELRSIINDIENAANIAEIGIGLNGSCRRNGDFEEEKKARGNVHVALGDNIFYGGTVECAVHIDMVLYRPTIRFDERIVVREGEVLR